MKKKRSKVISIIFFVGCSQNICRLNNKRGRGWRVHWCLRISLDGACLREWLEQRGVIQPVTDNSLNGPWRPKIKINGHINEFITGTLTFSLDEKEIISRKRKILYHLIFLYTLDSAWKFPSFFRSFFFILSWLLFLPSDCSPSNSLDYFNSRHNNIHSLFSICPDLSKVLLPTWILAITTNVGKPRCHCLREITSLQTRRNRWGPK